MIALLALAAAAAAEPATAFTIDPSHALIEGVASDGRSTYVSSVLDRQLLKCQAATCKPFATLPAGVHPLGIAWDERNRRLWVAADCPELPGIEPCERGALLAYDRQGKLRARIAPSAGKFHPGDVSASGGTVLIADSGNGALYRLRYASRELLPVIKPGRAGSAQGAVVLADGQTIIAADYAEGISRIDLATGKRTILLRADGTPLRGVDGVARCGDDLYAIFNGSSGILLKLRLAGDTIAYDKLVEGAIAPDPTQVTVAGDHLLFVADAGWEAAGTGTPRGAGARILALPLPAPCR